MNDLIKLTLHNDKIIRVLTKHLLYYFDDDSESTYLVMTSGNKVMVKESSDKIDKLIYPPRAKRTHY